MNQFKGNSTEKHSFKRILNSAYHGTETKVAYFNSWDRNSFYKTNIWVTVTGGTPDTGVCGLQMHMSLVTAVDTSALQ